MATKSHRRPRITLFFGVLALLSATLVNVPAATAASAKSIPCGDAVFVGVPGSGELDGLTAPSTVDNMGKVSGDLYGKLSAAYNRAGLRLAPQGISYTAVSIGYWLPTLDQSIYNNSELSGVHALETFLSSYFASKCKASLILSGYSQGAQALMDVYEVLPQPQKDRIAGIALFGDPEFNPYDTGIDRGTFMPVLDGIPPDHGVFGMRETSVDVETKAVSYCLANDPVCSYSGSRVLNCKLDWDACAHMHYTDSLTADASEFLYELTAPSPKAGVTGMDKERLQYSYYEFSSEVSFTIPASTCTKASSQIEIWTGIEGSSPADPTKAGVIGSCEKGVPVWRAFTRTDADSKEQPVAALKDPLEVGQRVTVHVGWQDNDWGVLYGFWANFTIDKPDGSHTVAETTIATTARGAAPDNMEKSTCAAERMPAKSGLAPLMQISDVQLSCLADGYLMPSSATLYRLFAMHAPGGRTLMSVGSTVDGVTTLHWVAAQ